MSNHGVSNSGPENILAFLTPMMLISRGENEAVCDGFAPSPPPAEEVASAPVNQGHPLGALHRRSPALLALALIGPKKLPAS